jgi:hypothetical protein
MLSYGCFDIDLLFEQPVLGRSSPEAKGRARDRLRSLGSNVKPF